MSYKNRKKCQKCRYEACLGAGMNGYIDKPVNPESLFEALSQWLTKAN